MCEAKGGLFEDVFPIVPVTRASNEYYRYDRTDWARPRRRSLVPRRARSLQRRVTRTFTAAVNAWRGEREDCEE